MATWLLGYLATWLLSYLAHQICLPLRRALAFIQGAIIIEFAEEYSKSEKIKRISLTLLGGILALIINDKWFLPFIDWYASTAHCHTPLGYPGVSVMFYSLFVGLPLFFAFWIGVILIPIGLNGLIQGQFPPEGVRVYKPTQIIRGWQAKIKSIFQLFLPVFLIVFSIWGYFQVDDILQKVSEGLDYSICKS